LSSPPLLEGVGVLVTRPERQAAALCRLLESHGASAYRFPALSIVEHPMRRALLARLASLPDFDCIIFISANAVRFGASFLAQRRDLPIAAVGPATARALNQAGYRVSVVSEEGSDSEHLLAHPQLASVQGKRILIVKGSGGRELLGHELKLRGAQVEFADVYERRPPAPTAGALASLEARFETGAVHLVTATSLEIARNLFAVAQGRLRTDLENLRWVAPSERVCAGIVELGARRPVIQAVSAEDQELVNAILRWRSAESGA
jgi:uroporphyrinogen-III synthase